MPPEKYLHTFLKTTPFIDKHTFIAYSAAIIGDVRIHNHASIWYQSVLRADLNYIEIGENSNIQDGTIIHLEDNLPTIIGKNVTVGHMALLHACTVKDNCLIGMRSTILNGAVIGEGSIIGACALVTSNKVIPPRSLVMGVPGKVVRPINEEEYQSILQSAAKYQEMAKAHQQLQRA